MSQNTIILKRKYNWFRLGLYTIAMVCFFYCGCKGRPETGSSPTSSSPALEEKSVKPDLSRLVGRWLRPDGGYILEIKSAGPDGTLEAGYFNPSPIHVGRAGWVEKDGRLYVMAELQDVNYPGSTYGLEYIADQDRLVGSYYQAVEKTTFDVEFIREK